MNEKRLKCTAYSSPESFYYQNGKMGLICQEGIKSIDRAYNQKRKWAMILGPKGVGKTEIAKYINSQGYAQSILFDKYVERKKKELAPTEDEVLDEIPFEMLLEEFQKEMKNGDKKKHLIFKDWPEPYTLD